MTENEAVRYLKGLNYTVQKNSSISKMIPDSDLYRYFVSPCEVFSPWASDEEINALVRRLVANGHKSLCTRDRIWVLMNLAKQSMCVDGEIWEAGVYQGGTATLLHTIILSGQNSKLLRLFDTFEGMPDVNPNHDIHKKGDFFDTGLEAVRRITGDSSHIEFHKGFIPDTFANLENSTIALAHIDLDIYQSIIDSCAFIYPRIAGGGFMLFDDYGFPSCPGARKAVDEFFADKNEFPICLPTGQALVVKCCKG